MIKLTPKSKNGFIKDSSVDCFQILSVSQERFVKKIGIISISILKLLQKVFFTSIHLIDNF